MDNNDFLLKVGKELQSLRGELQSAHRFHKVAIKERNAAWAEIESLKMALITEQTHNLELQAEVKLAQVSERKAAEHNVKLTEENLALKRQIQSL